MWLTNKLNTEKWRYDLTYNLTFSTTVEAQKSGENFEINTVRASQQYQPGKKFAAETASHTSGNRNVPGGLTGSLGSRTAVSLQLFCGALYIVDITVMQCKNSK